MRWCQTLGQKAGLNADSTIPHWAVCAFAQCPPWRLESAMQKATTFEHGGKVYEVRAIPTLNGWKVRIYVEGIPANGVTYSVDSEVYQDAALDGVPEDLVARADGNSGARSSARACAGIGDLRKGYRRRYRGGNR